MTETATGSTPWHKTNSVDKRVVNYLKRLGLPPSTTIVKRLHGDASDRSYVRVILPDSSSFVLAMHPEPFAPNALPQFHVGSIFEHLGIPIPRIIDQAGDLGLLAIDDLGDETLQNWLETNNTQDPTPLYLEAVGLIAKLQTGAANLADGQEGPFGLAFDTHKLDWEFDFFRSQFLETYRQANIASATNKALQYELSKISAELAAEPRVLCHRDYHSRNLMIKENNLVVIDFQDARMGPNTYDLVSLLRDCYVDLPRSLVTNMITHFLSAVPMSHAVNFHDRFNLMSVQRHLKALGTFGHQISCFGRSEFAAHVPRTLKYLRETLHAQPRFGRLLELLARLIPELI